MTGHLCSYVCSRIQFAKDNLNSAENWSWALDVNDQNNDAKDEAETSASGDQDIDNFL